MRVRYRITFLFISLFLNSLCAQGLHFDKPLIRGFHPLNDDVRAVSPLNSRHPLALEMRSSMFKDSSYINFEKREITFLRADQLGFIIWQTHYGELNEFLDESANFALYSNWRKESMPKGKNSDKDKPQNIRLQWELPVQYPSWAQRVLGKDPPRLSVNGTIKIRFSYDRSSQQREELNDALAKSSGFNFDQNNDFTITGSVGRLINLSISANNLDDFQNIQNPFENFKVEYKEATPGELEDEIVQEVTAGYQSFSLPGAQLAGYSESHNNLFGIKVASKLGPLNLTTIISTEHGESETQTINADGTTSDQYGSVPAYNYAINRFFFLDTLYRTMYNDKHNLRNKKEVTAPKVTALSVWKRTQKSETKNFPLANIDDNSADVPVERLIENNQYMVNVEEGWIAFTDSMASQLNNAEIAIYLRVDDPDNKWPHLRKGDTTTSPLKLWSIKSQDAVYPYQKPEKFYLQWRNVYDYNVDGANADFSVSYVRLGVAETLYTYKNVKLTEILGITDKDGKFNSSLVMSVVKKDEKVIVLPPWGPGFYGNEPFASDSLFEFKDTAMYRRPLPDLENVSLGYKPTFFVKAKKRGGVKSITIFDIDPGSLRVVTDKGEELTRNVDFVYDESMGTLDLVSARARSGNVKISYERKSFISAERKVFFGTRGEIKLPHIGENSSMGASFLWQNTGSNEKIPQLGSEAVGKMLFDVNTNLNFQPEWMTKAVNKLPLIETSSQSSANLGLEIAHSRMNPNKEKQAYIDNFEDNLKSYLIDNWNLASPPFEAQGDSIWSYPPAFDFYWFRPVSEDRDNFISEGDLRRDSTMSASEAKNGAAVLRLHCIPTPKTGLNNIQRQAFKNAWAGIMSPFFTVNNHSDMEFLEFVVRCEDDNGRFTGRKSGVLKFQFGEMREDLSLDGKRPNGIEDKEYEIDPLKFKSDLNIGLDRLKDDEEVYYIPDYLRKGEWIPLPYGSDSLGPYKFDPSRDNASDKNMHFYNNDHSDLYRYTGGRTERDNRTILDGEDIDNDGVVLTGIRENYFEYTIDLAKSDVAVIDTSEKVRKEKGWRKYRIPLSKLKITPESGVKYREIGQPNWKLIKMARIIWTGFYDSTSTSDVSERKIVLSQIQFTGNTWRASIDSTLTTPINRPPSEMSKIPMLELSPIGTDNNSEYERTLPREIDQYRNRLEDGIGKEAERSLRFIYKNVDEGQGVFATKNFSTNDRIDLSNYDTLSLMAYSKENFYDDKMDIVLRFGVDSTTYYEWRQPVQNGWNNHIQIRLRDFSQLKKESLESGDTISKGNQKIRWVGTSTRQPSFSNVTWVALGVFHKKGSGGGKLNGELWFNELKVKGIKNLNGFAARADFKTQWADLFNVNSNLSYTGGDFAQMTDAKLKPENTSLSTNVNGNMNLDKFLPSQWGINLPFNASSGASMTRPQILPSSDIYLTDSTNNKPDGIGDMAADMVNMVAGKNLIPNDTTASEHYETRSFETSYSLNYSKNNTSKNPFVNFTLDRLTSDFSHSAKNDVTNRGFNALTSEDYQRTQVSSRYNENLRYKLTPKDPPSWTKWKPFVKAKTNSFLEQYKEYEFNLLPTTLEFDLANASYSSSVTNDLKSGVVNQLDYSFNLDHGFQLQLSPIRPLLDLKYDVTMNRDLREVKEITSDKIMDILETKIFERDPLWKDYYILYGETHRTQKFSSNIRPQLVKWMTHTVDYSGDYNGNQDQTKGSVNSTVKSNFSFSTSLSISDLISVTGANDSTKKNLFYSVLKQADSLFEKFGFTSLSFNYQANHDLSNQELRPDSLRKHGVDDPFSFFAYQVGVKDRSLIDIVTANMDERGTGGLESSVASSQDRRAGSRNYTLQTSLRLPEPIDLSFSPLSVSTGMQYTVSPSSLSKDGFSRDTSKTIVDFQIGLNTESFIKLPGMANLLENLSFSSKYNFKWNSSSSGNGSQRDSSHSHDFSPLVRFEGQWKKIPIRFNFDHNHTRSFNYGIGKELSGETRISDQFGLTYKIENTSKLKEIKVLKWTIPVQGRTDMGLDIARDQTDLKNKEDQTSVTYKIVPFVNYVFTDKVTGRFSYTYSKSDQNETEFTTNKGEIEVTITF